jgi:alkylhydroperoxidase family enzyme
MKVALDSANVGEADYEVLQGHGFTDDDIWDIAAISGFFGLSNRLANMSAMRPNDEFFLMGRIPKAKP